MELYCYLDMLAGKLFDCNIRSVTQKACHSQIDFKNINNGRVKFCLHIYIYIYY